ncbi:MAG: sulfatase-like hydrolase/transferase, partial [Bacteroidota bacterium]
MTHKTLFCFFLTLAILTSCNQGPKEASQEDSKPNIIFIMADDHTTQGIGAYGSRLATLNPTPVIDRIAKEGVLLENAFCTNSICTPSRASILTGQY